ncbi:MAG: AAA family ATPase [Cellvibrionales bacterium]|nr:AAA family ATPase [Cellvibrionales bacterium]
MSIDPSLSLAFRYASSTLLKLGTLRHMQSSYQRFESYLELEQLGVFSQEDIEEESLEVMISKIRDSKETFANCSLNDTIVGQNLLLLGNAVGLSAMDIEIMVLLVLYKQYAILHHTSFVHGKVNLRGFCHAIAGMLEVDAKAVSAALSPTGRLLKSSLLNVYSAKTDFEDKFGFINGLDDYISDDTRTLQQLISLFISPVEDVTLSLEDYHHLESALDYIIPYVRGALESRTKGCNILLYGPPGTGKTELVKTLAKAVDAVLYEAPNGDADDVPMNGAERLRSYHAGCHLLDPLGRYLFLFDELEDVIQQDESGTHKKSSRNKAWFNRLLENTIIPTLWTSNQIHHLDPAYIRRFDIVLEVKPPEEQQRIRIMKKSCNTEHFEDNWLEHISKTWCYHLQRGNGLPKWWHWLAVRKNHRHMLST